MGYDVHITRAESWLDSDTQPILLEEWLAYVRSDPGMHLDGGAGAPAVWTASQDDGERQVRFHFEHGRITVKSPDAEILCQMSLIAIHFRARVQGDEGEDYYGSDGMPVES